MGVVAGSKASIAGYSAAVLAYYRHIMSGVGERREGRWGEEGGKREGERGECKETKVK